MINSIALSFKGRRENNQDSCIAHKLSEGIYFLAVADGMGGMAGGQVASRLVLQTILDFLKKEIKSVKNHSQLKGLLEKAFLLAQQAISQKIKEEPGLAGMGTTLTCVLIYHDYFIVGNIGDSRTYLLRDGELVQLTVDHTYISDYVTKVGEKADTKIMEQFGHYLTRSIDGGKEEPDIFPKNEDAFQVKKNDAFLLCSDGLILDKGENELAYLKRYLVGSKSITHAAQNLIAHAFHQGATDNISVVIAVNGQIPREKVKIKNFRYPPQEKDIREKGGGGRTVTRIFALIIVFLVAAILLLFSQWFKKEKLTKIAYDTSQVNEELHGIKITPGPPQILSPPKVSQFAGAANIPLKSMQASLSWAPAKVENDSIRHYIVTIYSDSLGKNSVDSKKVMPPGTNITLDRFQNLKPGHTYFWNVSVETGTNLKASSPFKKIILPKN